MGGGADFHSSVPSNEELPGKEFPPQNKKYEDSILAKCRELCGWRQANFPGAQPVSLAFGNLEEMARNPYVACEKTDGVRFLLFSTKTCVYLIDRLQKIRILENFFLPNQFDETARQHRTLLDGELVKDVQPDGSIRMRFLVFDAIAIEDDVQVKKSNFLNRLKRAYLEVIEPRTRYEAENPEAVEKEKETQSHLEVYLKDFFEIWDAGDVVKYGDSLPHESDGIIFTPVKVPYVPGTCKELLKWKPPHLNTVDFAARAVFDKEGKVMAVVFGACSRGTLDWRLCHGMCMDPSGPIYEMITQKARAQEDYTAKTSHVDTLTWIIECSFDTTLISRFVSNDTENGAYEFSERTEPGAWIGQRSREDKDKPNDKRTVDKVKQSIADGITLNKLLETFAQYRKFKRKVAECVRLTDPPTPPEGSPEDTEKKEGPEDLEHHPVIKLEDLEDHPGVKRQRRDSD